MGNKNKTKVKESSEVKKTIPSLEEKIIDEIEEDDFLNSGEWEEKLPPSDVAVEMLVDASFVKEEVLSGLSNVFKETAAAKDIEVASGKTILGYHPISNEPVYA